jgi:hypothetical protein
MMNTMIIAALASWRRGPSGGISELLDVMAGSPADPGAGGSLVDDERDHRLRHRGDVVAVAVAVIRCL